MITLRQRLDAATYAVFIFTAVLLCITGALALRADSVFVDGVKVSDAAPGLSAGAVTNIVDAKLAGTAVTVTNIVDAKLADAALSVTNLVDARLLTAVYGSTGITNIWTGTAKQYQAIGTKDSKTLYFTAE